MSQVPIPHERITYESKNVYIGGNIRFGAANVQSGPTVLDTSTTNGLKWYFNFVFVKPCFLTFTVHGPEKL